MQNKINITKTDDDLFLKKVKNKDFNVLKDEVKTVSEHMLSMVLFSACKNQEQDMFDMFMEEFRRRNVKKIHLQEIILGHLIAWQKTKNTALFLRLFEFNKDSRALIHAINGENEKIVDMILDKCHGAQVKNGLSSLIDNDDNVKYMKKIFEKKEKYISDDNIKKMLVENSYRGNEKTVKYLMGKTDNINYINEAFLSACMQNKKRIIDLLFDVSDKNITYERLKKIDEYFKVTHSPYFYEKCKSEDSKKLLLKEIKPASMRKERKL